MAQEVLIVDDDRALAESLARAVQQMGYRCRQAHDGVEAIESLAEAAPDAIVLDLLLPKKDGQSVLRAVRERPDGSAIAGIAMSAVFRGKDLEAQLVEAGAHALLGKPFQARELQAALHRAIGPPQAAAAVGEAEDSVERVDLSETSSLDVLWDAMASDFSGAVHFQCGKRHKILILEAGQPRWIRSNLAREALGRRLFDAGRIDERTFRESIRRSKATGRPHGEILVELGALTQAQLERALEDHSADKLLELFSWSEGESWLQPDVPQPKLASKLDGWTREQVVLRGVERLEATAMQRALEPHLGAAIRVGERPIDPGQGRLGEAVLLQRVEAGATVAELIDEFLPALFALWKIGAVQLEGAAPPSARANGEPGASKAASPDALRARIEQQEAKNHFEVLGVEPNASPAEVRQAFLRAAKSFHPDRFADADAEARELAARIFARLSDAHETLSNPKTRDEYARQIASGASTGAADRAEVARILSAEKHFQDAEGQIKRKEFTAAIQTLKEALELDPDEGEFHALLGWATLMGDPQSEDAQREAAETLKKAIALAPKSPTGYYYMGKLSRICGRMGEAERMFRKVLELRPRHAEATQEMRLIERRRNNPEAGAKGLFGLKRNK